MSSGEFPNKSLEDFQEQFPKEPRIFFLRISGGIPRGMRVVILGDISEVFSKNSEEIGTENSIEILAEISGHGRISQISF